MSGKIKLKISPGVAVFIGPGVHNDEKLRGLEATASMLPVDQVTLLFCLMRDTDSRVKEAASVAFGALPEERLLICLTTPGLHPSLLDTITRAHYSTPAVAAALLEYPTLSQAAAEYLRNIAEVETLPDDGDTDGGVSCNEVGVCGELLGEEDSLDSAAPEADSVDVEEDYLSKYQMIQLMGISEKIKMALTGDKEWRSILINDNNKLVSGSVVKNPRITEGEILQILKVGVQNDEIVRLICANREWVKNYLIRKALVDCPKTPLPLALRFLTSLNDKDIAGYAKSKNISSVISTQAKRIILAKKR
jgi:hypothetical protein